MTSSTPLPLALDDARALRSAGDWQALAARGDQLAVDVLLGEPELGLHVAVARRKVGQARRALELAGALEPEARRRGDRWLLTDVVTLIGVALWESGRVDEAEDRFAELLEAATAGQNEEASANAANNLGVLANVRGRRDLALTWYQRALAAHQRQGNVRGLAQTHHNLGISYRDLGFDSEADRHFARAIEFGQELETDELVAMAEIERAMLRVRRGDAELGGEMARRAGERFQRLGSPVGAADAQRVMAAAERERGRMDEALALLDAALATSLNHDDPVLRAEVQRDRGLLLRDQGSIGAARQALADSIERFALIGAAAEAEALRAILAELAADTTTS
ncbi:MAG TPA: tetratricopeptide repeat protein [Longimicrobium sp.]|nr:tetratricopeptide repeat protein [Longimicrobium sp.]